MQCPQCNAQLDDNAIFCGNCGNQVAPLQAQGATVVYNSQADKEKIAANHTSYDPPRSTLHTPKDVGEGFAPVPSSTPIKGSQSDKQQGLAMRPSASQTPFRRTNVRLIVLVVALILLVIAGGTLGVVLKNMYAGKSSAPANTTLAANANGVINFSDSPNGAGHNDVISITVHSLSTAPAGSQYDAWLVNSESEHVLALGTLKLQNGSYSLNFVDTGTNLLGQGNKVEVTVEQGTVTIPTGQIVLSATFPPKAFVHIRHLLFSFPNTPGKIGLLVGLVAQAQQLSAAAQLLQSIAPSHNSVAIRCVAQSILDIAEGTGGAHYQPLDNRCAAQNITVTGDGYGLLGTNGYIANGKAHAALAATQTDSTPLIRTHAQHVGICLDNMQDWITTIDQDALALLNNPDNTAQVSEIVTVSNHALNGVDLDNDGTVDPVKGEGGSITAYSHAQLMAQLTLSA